MVRIAPDYLYLKDQAPNNKGGKAYTIHLFPPTETLGVRNK